MKTQVMTFAALALVAGAASAQGNNPLAPLTAGLNSATDLLTNVVSDSTGALVGSDGSNGSGSDIADGRQSGVLGGSAFLGDTLEGAIGQTVSGIRGGGNLLGNSVEVGGEAFTNNFRDGGQLLGESLQSGSEALVSAIESGSGQLGSVASGSPELPGLDSLPGAGQVPDAGALPGLPGLDALPGAGQVPDAGALPGLSALGSAGGEQMASSGASANAGMQ